MVRHPVPTSSTFSSSCLSLQNFPTADRPRCMLRDESFPRHNRQFRGYDYGTDEYEQTSWHWNMSHQPNGDVLTNGKNACNSSRSQSSSTSGFQSFFRWFRRDEKHQRVLSDIVYPRDVTSSTDTLEYEHKPRKYSRNSRRKPKNYDSNDTLSPSPSPPPRLSRAFSQSSSCDSVFSTASSFAFVPPVKYLSNRNQKQVRLVEGSVVQFSNVLRFFVARHIAHRSIVHRNLPATSSSSRSSA
jgi:hypothetical protein